MLCKRFSIWVHHCFFIVAFTVKGGVLSKSFLLCVFRNIQQNVIFSTATDYDLCTGYWLKLKQVVFHKVCNNDTLYILQSFIYFTYRFLIYLTIFNLFQLYIWLSFNVNFIFFFKIWSSSKNEATCSPIVCFIFFLKMEYTFTL